VIHTLKAENIASEYESIELAENNAGDPYHPFIYTYAKIYTLGFA
jgi:hypothetical protein